MMKMWYITDEITQLVADIYCNGKSWIWRAFFGWRGFRRDGAYRFLLTEKQMRNICCTVKLIKEIKSRE